MSVARIAALRKKIQSENLDGMIITHLDYIRYLTGFTGSAGLLLIGPRKAQFLTDFRYSDQAAKQVKGASVRIVKVDPATALKDIPQFNVRNLRYGFDNETTTAAARDRLAAALPDALLIPAQSVIAEMGWVKEKSEVDSIIKAVEIADTAYERVLALVAPGIREREIAAELEYQMMMLGSEKPAFETIIASGYRSALPHGIATAKKVKKGDFITFDFGATVDGYVSDMTRTVVVGKATARQKKIYNLVKRAQAAGVRKIKAGVEASKVDEACRKIIAKAGYGKAFGHGTGHGIGFYVHVGPRLSGISKDKLVANNVVTVEPGVYLSGWGGVRIEDDVLVTRTGGRVLNRSTKNLLEL